MNNPWLCVEEFPPSMTDFCDAEEIENNKNSLAQYLWVKVQVSFCDTPDENFSSSAVQIYFDDTVKWISEEGLEQETPKFWRKVQ